MVKIHEGADPALQPKRTYRDLLFKVYFGKEEHKELTLQLYNALNHSSYTNVDDLEFYTLEDVLYLNYKNDVCFLLADTLSFYEQQSTLNPNMGYRLLLYFARVLRNYVKATDQNAYSKNPIQIPFPIFAVFYNGIKEVNEEFKLVKLSDLYKHKEKEANAEIIVRWYNVKKENNIELKESCPPLKEYCWTIDTIQDNLEKRLHLREAIEATLDAMDESFILYDYIQMHRLEVIAMLESEFNEEEYKRVLYKDAFRDGKQEGIAQGMKQGIVQGKEETFNTLVNGLMKEGLSQEEAIMKAKHLLQMDM